MTESCGRRGRLHDLKKQSTKTVAGLWASTSERVNLRTMATVLAWLTAVVGFALLFPFWVTVALAATALAAGVVPTAEQRVRATLIALPVIAVLAVSAYLLAHHASHRAQTKSTLAEPGTRKWVSLGFGVQAALEAKNLTFRNRWGTTIEAEGNDRLQFRLFLQNSNASAAPPLIGRLFVSRGNELGGGPRVISLSFGLGSNGPFTSGPEVKVVAQSNSLSTFSATPLRYGETSLSGPYAEPTFNGPEVEALSVPRPPNPPAEEDTGEEYSIPPIGAHGQLLVSFTGDYSTPYGGQIGGGNVVRIKNPGGPGKSYATTASAVPGHSLVVWAHFHNVGFRGTEVHARIRIGAQEHGRVGRIVLYASENRATFHELGFGTVNSGTGAPIKLTVQPGSTELIAPKTACSKRKAEPLPDGIAEGGVDVGDVEGWVPRDPCRFTELDRSVVFNVDVR